MATRTDSGNRSSFDTADIQIAQVSNVVCESPTQDDRSVILDNNERHTREMMHVPRVGRDQVKLPPNLSKGDKVAVVAPSSPVTREALAPGVAYLESLGLEVVVGSSVGPSDRFLAGPDTERGQDLNSLFADDSVRGIFAGRGGYGSGRTLSTIDWSVVRDHPKVLVGFSDTTALQLAAWTQAGLVSYTGMVLKVDVTGSGPVDAMLDASLRAALFEGRFEEVLGLRPLVSGGSIKGPLLGGCLSLVASLVGTPYLPSFEGAIVFLEDVGEAPYRVDRTLTQLILTGAFERVGAVVFGAFERCDGDDEDGTIEEVLKDFAGRVTCPVLTGLPYGHGPSRRVLPLGSEVLLTGDRIEFEVS